MRAYTFILFVLAAITASPVFAVPVGGYAKREIVSGRAIEAEVVKREPTLVSSAKFVRNVLNLIPEEVTKREPSLDSSVKFARAKRDQEPPVARAEPEVKREPSLESSVKFAAARRTIAVPQQEDSSKPAKREPSVFSSAKFAAARRDQVPPPSPIQAKTQVKREPSFELNEESKRNDKPSHTGEATAVNKREPSLDGSVKFAAAKRSPEPIVIPSGSGGDSANTKREPSLDGSAKFAAAKRNVVAEPEVVAREPEVAPEVTKKEEIPEVAARNVEATPEVTQREYTPSAASRREQQEKRAEQEEAKREEKREPSVDNTTKIKAKRSPSPSPVAMLKAFVNARNNNEKRNVERGWTSRK